MPPIEVEVSFEFAPPDNLPNAKELVRSAVTIILHREGFGEDRDAAVDVLLTDDARLRALNRTFANEDHATDVLSFSTTTEEQFGENGERIGDIAISLERTEAQASEKSVTFEHELAMLAIHGTLHLLGYDHAETEEARVMFGKTDEALREMFAD